MSDDKTPGMDLGALFGQVMEQARQVQDRVGQAQENLKDVREEGSAGGGVVKVVATGDQRIASVRIDKAMIDPNGYLAADDVEMLEDLVTAACNDALRRVQEAAQAEMGQATGGLDLGALGSMLGGGGK